MQSNSLFLSVLTKKKKKKKLFVMAADVSSLVRVLNRYKGDRTAGNDSKTTMSSLITQDLLGGSGGSASDHSINNEFQELDLDLQVPSGWEKRLDLKSGKVYLQRCNSPSSSSSSDYKHQQSNQTVPKLQDLNFPPSPSSKPLLNFFDESSLELKLVSSSSQSSSSTNNIYQSVCTLDKVKSALERAKKEPQKKRLSSMRNPPLPLSPSYSSSSSSIRDSKDKEEDLIMEENKFLACSISSPVAVGCPGCLCYVLIMKNNPKCPRCNSIVPLPAMKKPKIDLNISM
ncbi:uncharacterized protein LOC123198164 [Mangifera indica]|uniref:uncharacterized protein LOC123198164 n=1 Tax=Mangifera indica TaxID=29780 RepID=UPI001CFB82E1|nr:uncharacterized protein LOC123198164 [Mangifera indica]